MKKLAIIIFLLSSMSLFAQTTYVPDNNFEQALIDLGHDDDLDDYVLTESINTITYLDIDSKSISELSGIEDFTSLTTLYCSDNNLTNLDLSENINLEVMSCTENQISNLDVSTCTLLTELYCRENNLTSIDVTNNTNLIYFGCQDNLLTSIDINNNTSLLEFYCYTNQIESLDVSLNTSLTALNCFSNLLASLDLQYNTSLVSLICDENQLTNIDLSQNTGLMFLDCHSNLLTELDLSLNTVFISLRCYDNPNLGSVNVQNGNNHNIFDFSAENNSGLICIFVDDKTSAYLSSWTKDATATFMDNESECDIITYVPDDNFEQTLIDLGYDDVLDNSVLTANISGVTYLHVGGKNISDITGIEDFVSLTALYCWSNQLISLDVSANTSLTKLYCYQNQLTNLDVSANTSLTELSCYSNQLTSLNVLVNTSLVELSCGSNQLTSLDISANSFLAELYCSSSQLTSLDVSANTSLTFLSCYDNPLTSLNIYANTSLTYLGCHDCQLTGLDVSANTSLTELACFSNQLTSLDVSANTSLTGLACHENQITSLDVSVNSSLTGLWCHSNQLTSLNVRNGNNTHNSNFNATNNPNLTCIFVDDATWSETNWTNIDATSTFVETEAECDALDVESISNNTFTIYPNPTKDKFSINTNNKIENIKVYGVFGKLIKVYNKQASYSVSDLASGVYLIHIQSEGGIKVSKLVVK